MIITDNNNQAIDIYSEEFHGMLTKEGNMLVHELIEQCQENLHEKPERVVRRELWDGVNKIARRHPEVYDQEVRFNISYEMKVYCIQNQIAFYDGAFDY